MINSAISRHSANSRYRMPSLPRCCLTRYPWAPSSRRNAKSSKQLHQEKLNCQPTGMNWLTIPLANSELSSNPVRSHRKSSQNFIWRVSRSMDRSWNVSSPSQKTSHSNKPVAPMKRLPKVNIVAPSMEFPTESKTSSPPKAFQPHGEPLPSRTRYLKTTPPW